MELVTERNNNVNVWINKDTLDTMTKICLYAKFYKQDNPNAGIEDYEISDVEDQIYKLFGEFELEQQ